MEFDEILAQVIELLHRTDTPLLLAAQIDAADDVPPPDRIYAVGTVASVVQLLKLPAGTVLGFSIKGTLLSASRNFGFDYEMQEEGNRIGACMRAQRRAVTPR